MSGHAFSPADESRDLTDSQENASNQQTFYANPSAIQDIATDVCCVRHAHWHWRSKAIASGTSKQSIHVEFFVDRQCRPDGNVEYLMLGIIS